MFLKIHLVNNPDNPDFLDALITAYEDVFMMKEFSEKAYG